MQHNHLTTASCSSGHCLTRAKRPLAVLCASILNVALAASDRVALADAPLTSPPAPRVVGAVSPKLLRYAERMVRKHDVNKSGQLEADEWSALQGKPPAIDANGDGRITVEEFAQHAADFGAGRAIRLSTANEPLAEGNANGAAGQAGAANAALPQGSAGAGPLPDPRRGLKYFAALPAGIPQWFVERDADGDSQLTLAEYSPKLLKSEIDDFARYDVNRDGVLTAKEYLRAGKETGAAASSPLK